METWLAALLLPLSGLIAGGVLGYVARRNFFCTLSALEQHWYANNSSGLRTWVLAAAFAALITQALSWLSIADPSGAIYLAPSFGWLGAIVGGLAFGFGMALVGTCGFGALVRLGGGSLKSLISVLVLGLSALSTLRGLLAIGRTQAVEPVSVTFSAAGSQSIPAIAGSWAGSWATLPVTLLLLAAPFAWVFADGKFRRNGRAIGTALTVGMVVAFGWVATPWLASVAFEPVRIQSASFVTPVAETIMQFVVFTGVGPNYGVGMVIGTVLGSMIAARSADDVRWEACEDARELSRHILGGICMGFGGVLALGCTIGQGISAWSVLAVSVPVVMVSIVFGARMGLAWLIEGSALSPVRHSAIVLRLSRLLER